MAPPGSAETGSEPMRKCWIRANQCDPCAKVVGESGRAFTHEHSFLTILSLSKIISDVIEEASVDDDTPIDQGSTNDTHDTSCCRDDLDVRHLNGHGESTEDQETGQEMAEID